MDWSKAKSIMIAALLVCDLIIAGFYIRGESEYRKEQQELTASAVEYLEQKNIKVDCAVPTGTRNLRVLNLEFAAGSSAGQLARTKYKGMPVEVLGLKNSSYINKISKTKAKIKVEPAYTALLKCMDSVSASIEDVELIYLVDRSGYGEAAGSDTALPYWKILAGGSAYYYAAY